MAIPVPQPPEPLTPAETSIELVKSRPPQPQILYYLVAVLTVVGGLIMGWVYLVKDGASNKLFGIRAILAAFLIPAALTAYLLVQQSIEKRQQAPLPDQPGIILPE
jgi:hypothetical protein